MNLLLIDTRIPDLESIGKSVTENTHCVVFDYETDTFETIKSQLQGPYENVGIIQHNYSEPSFQLLKSSSQSTLSDVSTVDPELTSWQEYIEFFEWFTASGTQHIDLFACNLWSDENWRYVIETIRTTHNVHIRASINITGEGGDFILESDNVDTIGMYFLPEILNYKYAFYYSQMTMNDPHSIYRNKYRFQFPSTNVGEYITTNYSDTFGTYPNRFLNSSNIKEIIPNKAGAFAILYQDGTVSAYGNGTSTDNNAIIGQPVPTDINDGIPVTKIVAGYSGFAALKSDGSVRHWGSYTSLNQPYISDSDLVDKSGFVRFSNIKSSLTNIVDIYVSSYNTHTVYFALNSIGNVYSWGYTSNTCGKNDVNSNIFSNNYSRQI